VELVICIVSIVDKQVYTVVPYCNITVNIADKISVHNQNHKCWIRHLLIVTYFPQKSLNKGEFSILHYIHLNK